MPILPMVSDRHQHSEAAFAAVKAATGVYGRIAVQTESAVMSIGQAIAEEALSYPAVVAAGEKSHATRARAEQSAAMTQLGLLKTIPPMCQHFLDKFEHI